MDGTATGEIVKVYGANGVMHYSAPSTGSRLSFPVASKGFYFVQVGGKSHKMMVN